MEVCIISRSYEVRDESWEGISGLVVFEGLVESLAEIRVTELDAVTHGFEWNDVVQRNPFCAR